MSNSFLKIMVKDVEDSTVLINMKTRPHYTPYCGNMLPVGTKDGCHNPRTVFSLKHNQFLCPQCGWISQHSDANIEQYKKFNSIN